MNPITFPGLGLEFQIDRVACNLFGKDIYWYGIIIAVGFLLGVLIASRQAKKIGIQGESLVDMLFFALPIGIICARIYYVIFYMELYYNADGTFNWGEAVAIWDGGIAIYGGIIGATLTCLVFCLLSKQKFWAMADCCSFGLLLGQAIGRWGNFINQEAFGSTCTQPWRMGLTTAVGDYIEVHPTFLYESLWNVVGLLLLLFVVKRFRKFDGELFCSYLLWYGAGRYWIEGLRTDSLYLFDTGIRVSQLLAAITAVCAAVAILYMLLIRKCNGEDMLCNRLKDIEAEPDEVGVERVQITEAFGFRWSSGIVVKAALEEIFAEQTQEEDETAMLEVSTAEEISEPSQEEPTAEEGSEPIPETPTSEETAEPIPETLTSEETAEPIPETLTSEETAEPSQEERPAEDSSKSASEEPPTEKSTEPAQPQKKKRRRRKKKKPNGGSQSNSTGEQQSSEQLQ